MKGTNKLKEHKDTYFIRLDSHKGLCQSKENAYFKVKLISKYKPCLNTNIMYVFSKFIKYKPIVYTLKNYNLNSREKFEHGPPDL